MKRPFLEKRSIAALIVSLPVFFMASSFVLLNDRPVGRKQTITKSEMGAMVWVVERHHRQKNAWPHSIDQIKGTALSERGSSHYVNDYVDGWKRPYIYRATKKAYQIISYGADGKPGGKGTNLDLTNSSFNSPEAQPTLLEILTYHRSLKMIATAGVIAVITFLVARNLLSESDLVRGRFLIPILKLFFTFIAAAFVALIAMVMHLMAEPLY